jgi:hypothetical protein
MTRLLLAASASALSLTLLAGAPSFAQTRTAEQVLLTMSGLGIETEGLVLTEEQVRQVELILETNDDDPEKITRIKALLGM